MFGGPMALVNRRLLPLTALVLGAPGAAAALLRGPRNSTKELTGPTTYEKVPLTGQPDKPVDFEAYYSKVTSGRGIWKWNNALAAYDRHLLQFRNKAVEAVEIGVQSGGSLSMWRAVLGPQARVHGMDVNPLCANFADARTSITIGDQGNPEVWQSFFKDVAPSLDFCVDDGGHLPHQMLQTTSSVFPKLKPGGVLAIEDIHGAHYLQSLFEPLAQILGPNPSVASLHLYPYLLIVQKEGSKEPAYDPSQLRGQSVWQRIRTLPEIAPALAKAPAGTLLVLENPDWPRFINAHGLKYFFQTFIDLYQPRELPDNPKGCATTSAAVCTSETVNSDMMSKVYAVHILPTRLVIEVPQSTPVIKAVRHGTVWIEAPANNSVPSYLKGLMNSSGPAKHMQVVRPVADLLRPDSALPQKASGKKAAAADKQGAKEAKIEALEKLLAPIEQNMKEEKAQHLKEQASDVEMQKKMKGMKGADQLEHFEGVFDHFYDKDRAMGHTVVSKIKTAIHLLKKGDEKSLDSLVKSMGDMMR